MAATTVTITVAGMFSDAGFQQCRVIAENLASVVEHVSVEVLAMVEHDWEQYIDAKGRAAAKALVGRIDGGSQTDQRILLAVELVVGGSTARPPDWIVADEQSS